MEQKEGDTRGVGERNEPVNKEQNQGKMGQEGGKESRTGRGLGRGGGKGRRDGTGGGKGRGGGGKGGRFK